MFFLFFSVSTTFLHSWLGLMTLGALGLTERWAYNQAQEYDENAMKKFHSLLRFLSVTLSEKAFGGLKARRWVCRQLNGQHWPRKWASTQGLKVPKQYFWPVLIMCRESNAFEAAPSGRIFGLAMDEVIFYHSISAAAINWDLAGRRFWNQS